MSIPDFGPETQDPLHPQRDVDYFVAWPGTSHCIPIRQRDGKVCQYCGDTQAVRYTVDHIIPRSRGGRSTKYNLVVACWPCNSRKRAKVWIPNNLDMITVKHPEHRALILELAVPHE